MANSVLCITTDINNHSQLINKKETICFRLFRSSYFGKLQEMFLCGGVFLNKVAKV